ncbi:MAG: selenium-dependent xanthine dehydrogenase [Treponema sp.]|jgi:selenium-dependent xanthine dehydrogenase|nr:selenium-dependent xanthine dehydrogenase [Treponema sp.]
MGNGKGGGAVVLAVNGRMVSGPPEKRLLDFLREDLRLTAVKNGCGSGACGACTVHLDGRPVRACVPVLSKIAGRTVITPEGLSKKEKEVYAFAFAEAGAVQCGFCIPGMVMSAKALLDVNASPDEGEIRRAIRSNICRCTGYVKIIKAVQLAAALFREGLPLPVRDFRGRLGENFHRIDAAAKTLGTGKYTGDLDFPGMLYASALRSAYPRARVLKIDASAALAHPDCAAVFTAKDIPGNIKIGHLAFISDYDVMITEGEITRFIGDALALAVCGKKESLDEVKSLIRVDYQTLRPLASPAEAMAEGAPLIHRKERNILSHERLVRGSAEKALAESAHVVSRHFSAPFTEHAFMESECAIAMPDPENGDGLVLYSAGQGVYDEQRECSRMLGIAPEKIRVKGQLVGGGFGGKEDMSVQHHACLAAWLLGKPVKVLLSREESIRVHPKRHAMEIDFTLGCDGEGRLTAMKASIVSDTGAYASLGGPVLQRACTHAAGPYNFQVIDIEGKAVYTNNIPGGAFRGFGVPQSCFAMESCLNLLAEKAGISPWEIRFRNAVRPGDVLPNGQRAGEDTELEACLLEVKDTWEKAAADGKSAGIACGFKNAGIGVGLPDTGRCILSVERGIIHIRTSAACIGQGIATVVIQIACQTLNLPPGRFAVDPPDTARTPDSGTTTASRQTVFTREAVRAAAEKLRERLLSVSGDLARIEGEEFHGEYSGITDPMGSDKPNPVSHIAYSYAAAVAVLGAEGRVEKIRAAYDIGTVVNPPSAEGQVEGGLLMGMGYALTEDFPVEGGYPKAKYGTLGLLRATDVPSMEIVFVKPKNPSPPAYGAKGVGELAAIPVTPAIAGAYYMRDGKFRCKLPLEDTFYRKKQDRQ